MSSGWSARGEPALAKDAFELSAHANRTETLVCLPCVTTESLVSIHAITPFVDGVRRAGADVDAFVRGLGLDPAVLGDRTARVPLSAAAGLADRAAAFVDDPDFGLHAGEHVDERTFRPAQLTRPRPQRPCERRWRPRSGCSGSSRMCGPSPSPSRTTPRSSPRASTSPRSRAAADRGRSSSSRSTTRSQAGSSATPGGSARSGSRTRPHRGRPSTAGSLGASPVSGRGWTPWCSTPSCSTDRFAPPTPPLLPSSARSPRTPSRDSRRETRSRPKSAPAPGAPRPKRRRAPSHLPRARSQRAHASTPPRGGGHQPPRAPRRGPPQSRRTLPRPRRPRRFGRRLPPRLQRRLGLPPRVQAVDEHDPRPVPGEATSPGS